MTMYIQVPTGSVTQAGPVGIVWFQRLDKMPCLFKQVKMDGITHWPFKMKSSSLSKVFAMGALKTKWL
jgi:hypothetical protein